MINIECFGSSSAVSVPIWGLFNLTVAIGYGITTDGVDSVSVPIWGLFNLTLMKLLQDKGLLEK